MEQQQNTQPFVIERTYNTPIAKVWSAITDNEKMKQWYFQLDEFKPEVGFEFSFEGGTPEKTYLHLCKVTRVTPGKLIAYTWRYDGLPGNSEVTWELFDEGDKTRLKLTHTGLHTFTANDPNFARESFSKGWTHITSVGLQNYLDKE
ncbi:MAG: SRPBCC domain-containing protein [Mucilaginibacter sp.]|uniref:SRPBCC family protein n=1 Tax=Mucilaginibacter sp. TaxID=1882438 RepID=UPI00326719ED